jgi:hypothetical protein
MRSRVPNSSIQISNRKFSFGGLVRGLLSFVVVLFFILSLTLAIIFYSVVQSLEEPANWERIILQTNLAERSQPLLADFLVSYTLTTGEEDSFIGDFSLQSWQGVADVLFPDAWLEQNAIQTMTIFLGWMDGDQPGLPDIHIDLAPVLETLRGPQGSLAVLPLLQGFEECPPGQGDIVLFADQLVTCLPANQDLTQIGSLVARYIAAMLIPEISLNSLESAGMITPMVYQNFDKARLELAAIQAAIVLGWRGALFLLCVYALLQIGNWPGRSSGLALPFYLVAGVNLALLVVWHFFLAWGARLSLTMLMPEIELETQALLIDLVKGFSSLIEQRWLLLGAACLVVAVLAHLAFYLLGRYQHGVQAARSNTTSGYQRQRIRKQFR